MGNENRPDEDLSNTGTRKPDEAVGSRGPHPAGGGHQTAEQAAITGQGSGGRSDAERREGQDRGAAGRTPPAIGGSSGGHSDRKASAGPREGEPVAGEPERAKHS
ncbi:hypothetical protein ASF53_09050 [Methylobacterium sp. Leaf123]|uniref:hypothetical protein n=1 Tax=Methylobacterium sp. Leaf123 TaxID=1736264 RepID=UPI0006F884D1|nr:hypothetical protein [Methylobacterium sp. Leaf123]KQQ14756.1 hypothetical protein ASF53_09050 [Methylobacterium sp. Leaf123]